MSTEEFLLSVGPAENGSSPRPGSGASGAGGPKKKHGNTPEQEEVERLLLALHDTMGQLSIFLTSKERRNQFAAAAEDSDGGSDDNLESAEKAGGKSSATHEKQTDLLDGFLYYVRSVVTQAMKGGRRSHVAPVPVAPQGGGNSRQRESEASQLRSLLKATISELDAERREKHEVMTEMREFNRIISEYRAESNVLQVYKDRIVELQAVINGTRKPGDITATVGELEQDISLDHNHTVPADITLTEPQKRKEVANEMARLATRSKEQGDRMMVENMKLKNDKVALIGQTSILHDRVKVLEAQLSVLTASSSIALRELSKQRLQTAVQVEAPHSLKRQLGKGEVRVGGTIMEAEVAVWLRSMYQKLLQDADATKQLMNIREDGTSPALSQGGLGDRGPQLGSPIGGVVGAEGVQPGYNVPGASRIHSSQSARPGSGASNTGSTIASRGTGTPANGQGRAGSGSMNQAETRNGKTFTEFVATLPRDTQSSV